MYERWTPADLQQGRTLLLVAWDPKDLTGKEVESHAERWGPIEDDVLIRDGRVVRHYYHRVAYNYRSTARREEIAIARDYDEIDTYGLVAAGRRRGHPAHSAAIAQTPEQQTNVGRAAGPGPGGRKGQGGAAGQAARGPQGGPHGLGTHAGSHVRRAVGNSGRWARMDPGPPSAPSIN